MDRKDIEEAISEGIFGAISGLQGKGHDYLPTLRDQFAMAALTGMISTSGAPWLMPDHHNVEPLTAAAAYKMADAMIEARKPKI